MSDSPDLAALTPDEQLLVLDAIWARTSMKSGYPNTEWGIDFSVIESIIAARTAALLDRVEAAEAKCECGPWHPGMDGPDEFCPLHGRSYKEWSEKAVEAQRESHDLRLRLEEAERERDEWLRRIDDVANGDGFTTEIRGVKIQKCDEYGRTDTDYKLELAQVYVNQERHLVDMVTAERDAYENGIRELADELFILSDPEPPAPSLPTTPGSVIRVEHQGFDDVILFRTYWVRKPWLDQNGGKHSEDEFRLCEVLFDATLDAGTVNDE